MDPRKLPPHLIGMNKGQDLLYSLLGCAWGRQLSTPDDTEPCNAQAVQIVIIHDGDVERAFKLCAHHVERIRQETTERKED